MGADRGHELVDVVNRKVVGANPHDRNLNSVLRGCVVGHLSPRSAWNGRNVSDAAERSASLLVHVALISADLAAPGASSPGATVGDARAARRLDLGTGGPRDFGCEAGCVSPECRRLQTWLDAGCGAVAVQSMPGFVRLRAVRQPFFWL